MNMQYDDIFRYQFDSLYSMTKEFMFCNILSMEESDPDHGEDSSFETKNLFDIFKGGIDKYNRLTIGFDQYRNWIEIYVYKIVINMMRRASIPYTEVYHENHKEKNSVIIRHESKQIQAYFLYDITDEELNRTPYDKLADSLRNESEDVDKVKVYVFRDCIAFPSLANLVNSMEGNEDRFVEVCSLKEFFLDFFSEETYFTFVDFVHDYCEKSNKLLALRTVMIPTETTLSAFKERKKKMLDCFDYKRIMHSGFVGSLNEKEFETIRDNCMKNDMFSAMIGKSDFAESFISAEWSYDVYSNAMGDLEKTGIIAGYLKSIEQLLGVIVGFHRDQGFKILTKNRRIQPYTSSNEEEINSTLGSLMEFVRNANLPLSANIRGCFTLTLNNWKDDERNGYFHKDNLFCSEKMAEVRETTLFLYFIILGGLKYTTEEMFELGVRSNNLSIETIAENNACEEQFKKWLGSAIEFDSDDNAPFYYFKIHDCDGRTDISVYKIHEFSMEAYEEGTITREWILNNYIYDQVKKWPTFSWTRSQGENENLLVQVLNLVSSFSEENPEQINKVGGIIGSYKELIMLLHKKEG